MNSGDRPSLRPLLPSDRSAFLDWFAMPEFEPFYPPGRRSLEQGEMLFEQLVSGDSRLEARGIEVEDTLVGMVRLRQAEGRPRASLGYEIHPGWWRRGIAYEAVRQMLDFGFRDMELHRIDAWVYGCNEPSMRLLEKLGFTQEGCLREKVPWGDLWMDDLIYGMLRREWPSRSAQ